MIELNSSNFEEHTKDGLVLVDFYAPWCGPCRALSPIVEKLQNIKVFKVNIDDSPELANEFKVSIIPFLVFLRNGVEVESILGVQSQNALQ